MTDEKKVRQFVRVLFPVYEAWWHQIGGFDPGDDSANVLITFADDSLMQDVCLAVEPFEEEIRAYLEAK